MADRAYILSIISDLTKDATGSRIRLDYQSMTDSELQSTFDFYSDLLEVNEQRESVMRLRAQKDWEQSLERLMSMGATSMAQAIAWDMEAEGVNDNDYGFYCYLKGLSYDLEARIVSEVSASEERIAA
jgi:hypothetical protein